MGDVHLCPITMWNLTNYPKSSFVLVVSAFIDWSCNYCFLLRLTVYNLYYKQRILSYLLKKEEMEVDVLMPQGFLSFAALVAFEEMQYFWDMTKNVSYKTIDISC